MTVNTETARFKTGANLCRLGRERRNAVNSLQTGLSQGIGGKLKSMKAERDALNLASSGRDLVPLKTSVIDDETGKARTDTNSRRGRASRRATRTDRGVGATCPVALLE